MIGHLRGTVLKVSEKSLLLDVGGVGYKIQSPLSTLITLQEGASCSLFIHTHVREDALALYGFENEEELELFEKLRDVSGIGPKSALAMLSVHSPASIADAIERSDAELLAHTPGIGKKTAEKVILELKGKVSHLQSVGGDQEASFEVRLALEALGYSPKEVHTVVGKLNTQGKDSSTLIKEALALLK
jgi:Holliday junction DNA helicase RuvA